MTPPKESHPRRIRTHAIHNGRLIRLNRDTVDLPNGKRVELDIVHHPGGAVVVALNARGEVCLLEQFRHAVDGYIWELPAGCIDPEDATPLDTARRELEEEAGWVAAQWESLGSIYTTPGFCDEVLHLFLARELAETRTNRGESELIEVCWLPLSEAVNRVLTEKIKDSKTIVALLKVQALFSSSPRMSSR